MENIKCLFYISSVINTTVFVLKTKQLHIISSLFDGGLKEETKVADIIVKSEDRQDHGQLIETKAKHRTHNTTLKTKAVVTRVLKKNRVSSGIPEGLATPAFLMASFVLLGSQSRC